MNAIYNQPKFQIEAVWNWLFVRATTIRRNGTKLIQTSNLRANFDRIKRQKKTQKNTKCANLSFRISHIQFQSVRLEALHKVRGGKNEAKRHVYLSIIFLLLLHSSVLLRVTTIQSIIQIECRLEAFLDRNFSHPLFIFSRGFLPRPPLPCLFHNSLVLRILLLLYKHFSSAISPIVTVWTAKMGPQICYFLPMWIDSFSLYIDAVVVFIKPNNSRTHLCLNKSKWLRWAKFSF